ncbi:nucleoside deaminase [Morganella psychrotolerans]|uniref:Nucleoside deaminase n=1 Tax=Morganella psychrotolerans TaxID=368603 RepID=A0A5M9R9H3_9GAMM|nr:nucleoside deaminase [Morganella psychrotolerans]KAA8717261.1 nucleoside deaminase [Morganella psychrotolerans]OBU08450.1 tRNA-specific adenosine deaminase [Morganella psychrotolerans]
MADKQFLQQAIALARRNIEKGGRPFGAVIVKDGKIISEGVNQMAELNDPTAHAELLALRHAGQTLGQTRLEGCVVYASGQPCPMCLAAMRMAGITRAVYAYSNSDAQPYGLSTELIAVALRADPHEQTGFSFTQQKPDDEPSLYAQWQAHQH